MMKTIKIITLLLFALNHSIYSQVYKVGGVEVKSLQGSVKDVRFKMSSSHRYPYNKVDIHLEYMRKKDSVRANVKCLHNNPNPEYIYTTDTIIGVSKKQFSNICSNLFEIQSDSIKKYFFMSGKGRKVSVTYGDHQVYVSYGLSNPSKEMEYNFHEACRLTLELVGIKPSLFLSTSPKRKKN